MREIGMALAKLCQHFNCRNYGGEYYIYSFSRYFPLCAKRKIFHFTFDRGISLKLDKHIGIQSAL